MKENDYKMDRLDKIIASQTGLSRKETRLAIYRGDILVNNAVTRLIDMKVDPALDEITFRGEKISYQKFLYIMMNKPQGVVSATVDSREKTAISLLPDELSRRGLFPAGRLDKDTTGLLIITNDGGFAHRMLAPGKGIFKTYIAELDGPLPVDAIKRFAEGILLENGEQCLPAEVIVNPQGTMHNAQLESRPPAHFLDDIKYKTHVQVKIQEGKYHQVKRMFAACETHVVSLKRTAIGGLRLDGNLGYGEYRMMDGDEIQLAVSS